MISLIGLILILLGWVVQLIVMRHDRKINPVFIILYIIGSAMIAYEDFFRGWGDLSAVNLLIMLAAIVVFIVSLSNGKKKNEKKK